MRITIVDLEWYNHKSFVPNPKCMKISSYYKQQKAIINFATTQYDLKLDYDKMYVVRESLLGGEFPREIDLLDSNVFLIGEGLKYYDRYLPDIDDIMAACRPDYLLYPLREENKMSKANMVQFFHEGKLLPLIQDYKNTYNKAHFTYVTDRDFWKYSATDIEKCFKKLRFDKYIVFADGLDLNLIFQSKKKTEILQKLNIDWVREKIFITLDNDKTIQTFLKFVEHVPESARSTWNLTSPIVYSSDHFKKSGNWLKDFYRYFRLIGELKKRRVQVRFMAPERLTSPSWFFFEDLERWSIYGRYESFVEFMIKYCADIHNVTMEYLMRHSSMWSEDSVHRVVFLWKKYPEMMEETGYIQWDDKIFNELDMRRYIKEKK